MSSVPKDFDLLFVISYFRSALPILSIIRYLSSRFSIGLCFQPLNLQLEAKTGDAQRIFERLCKDSGGFSYVPNSSAKCRLMLVQQHVYTDSFVASVREHISAEETWGMLALASMGLAAQDAFITQFSVSHLTVPDKKLANFLLHARDAFPRYRGLKVTEVGLPFHKYPVFEEYEVDWIVAAPTLFSFHTEACKQSFLRTVIKLMEQISECDVIVYKSHNGNAKDYFTPRVHAEIARIISRVPNVEVMLERLIKGQHKHLQYHLNKVLTALLHLRVTRRAVSMYKLTTLADMSLEAFLPGVRKGIIGGLSNTTWGALYFGLPYYNCVDQSTRSGHSALMTKSSDNLLGINLKYFGVPFCKGDLSSDVRHDAIAEIKDRSTNIVDLIIAKLEGV